MEGQNPTNQWVYVLKLPKKKWDPISGCFIFSLEFLKPFFFNIRDVQAKKCFFFHPRFSPRLQEIPSDGWPRLLSEEEVEAGKLHSFEW